ncbi:DUF4249 domain-containing protein [Flavobacterium limnosediminis]|uniref:DUF4249 domain-containing protein n=1 Tax=Flavobacterium limnosediminis TaxID=1401027 RepID=UPI00042591EA|nr:DUF4249 domain-containing protein [Flavobacterium limnosediminis]
MKTALILKFITALLLFTSIVSCTEPYQIQTETFEEAYVIEATITNELKKQQIKISKTYRLEENGPTFESGADVYVEDDLGNQYEFAEQNNVYESTIEFQALPERQYQLFINTADGREYSSAKETLTTVTEIENLSTTVVSKDNQTGVEIGVNSYDPTGTSKYYRYEYEETSKVTAPKWNRFKTILLAYPRICEGTEFPGFETIGFELRTGESKVCFTTKNSIEILLTSTVSLNEDRVTNFPVRFIANTDYTIAERYSILVKQYVQTLEAYTFYKTMKDMSGSESLLSPKQPGFINGNIKSVSNPKEKVIGFFEVASVSSKRIFFNFHDIFPDTLLPSYPWDCTEQVFNSMDFGTNPHPTPEYPCGTGGPGLTLRSAIRRNTLLFYREAFPTFYMVKPACGDCTTFASNIVPPFWQ